MNNVILLTLYSIVLGLDLALHELYNVDQDHYLLYRNNRNYELTSSRCSLATRQLEFPMRSPALFWKPLISLSKTEVALSK